MDADGSLGTVSISTGAIAQIVGFIAGECYGVAAVAGRVRGRTADRSQGRLCRGPYQRRPDVGLKDADRARRLAAVAVSALERSRSRIDDLTDRRHVTVVHTENR